MKPIDTWRTASGHVVSVYQEPDPTDPREWASVGVMVTAHGRYRLGDEWGDAIDFGDETPRAYFARTRGSRVVLPLWLYDHRRLTIRVGDPENMWSNPFAGQRGTGLLGFIIDTPGRVTAALGADATDAEVEAALRAEVEAYDHYLRWNTYGYVVVDAVGNEVAACWGLLGDLDHVRAMVAASLGEPSQGGVTAMAARASSGDIRPTLAPAADPAAQPGRARSRRRHP